jgi:hypothetical protein
MGKKQMPAVSLGVSGQSGSTSFGRSRDLILSIEAGLSRFGHMFTLFTAYWPLREIHTHNARNGSEHKKTTLVSRASLWVSLKLIDLYSPEAGCGSTDRNIARLERRCFARVSE